MILRWALILLAVHTIAATSVYAAGGTDTTEPQPEAEEIAKMMELLDMMELLEELPLMEDMDLLDEGETNDSQN